MHSSPVGHVSVGGRIMPEALTRYDQTFSESSDGLNSKHPEGLPGPQK